MSNMRQELFLGLPLPRWRAWRDLAILGLIVMELSWLVPWYRSLTLATYAVSPGRAFLVLGGILLSTHLIARFMNFVYLRLDIRRIILIAIFVISFFVGIKLLLYESEAVSFWELINRPLRAFSNWTVLIPDEFVIGVMVLVVCWRGISLAQARVGPVLVKRTFQIGIFMFVGFVLINTLATGESPGPLLYVFIFAGLLAMGSARISVLRTLRGGEQSPFDRRWFLGMVIASLVMVGLAGGIAMLTSSEFDFYERVVTFVLRAFAFLLAIIMAPIVYPILLLLDRIEVPGLSDAASRLLENLEGLRSALLDAAGRLAGRLDFLDRLPNLQPVLLWSVIAVLVLLMIAGVTRWWVNERRRLEAEHQIILNRGDMLRLLRQSLANQFNKLGEGLAGLARLRYGRRLLAAARIRRIYVELMSLGEQLDLTRSDAETPLEFLPALRRLFPSSGTELNTITQAYLRIRYGELPETQAEVDQVESAWHEVSTQGQEMLSNRKRTSQA